jgi:hypothetical protein
MNRRERRKLEKQFGLMKEYQKGNKQKRSEIRARRTEMGKMLHQQHLQKCENENRNKNEEREAKAMQDLIASGKSEKEAKDIIDQRYKIKLEAAERLEERRNRQAKVK